MVESEGADRAHLSCYRTYSGSALASALRNAASQFSRLGIKSQLDGLVSK